jgi:ATP synthase protein I
VENNKSLHGLYKLLALQMALCILAPVVLLLLFGQDVALSALFGALTAFVPSLVFIRKLFKYQGARAAKKIVRNFYIGEGLKLLLSVVLFAAVFALYSNIKPLAFFMTYIAMLLTHWLSPLLISKS